VKRTLIASAIAALITVGVALTAFAQNGSLASLLNPLVVTIQQSVPVDLTLSTASSDGSAITSTVPVTIGVDLAVTIQGARLMSVVAAEAPANVTVAVKPVGPDGNLVDDFGIPYTLEGAEGVKVLSLRSTQPSYNSSLHILGEVQNETDEDQRVEIRITVYATDGRVLQATSTYPQTTPLPASDKSAFQLMTTTDVEAIAEYRLQIFSD
jgi:hypothetical protein